MTYDDPAAYEIRGTSSVRTFLLGGVAGPLLFSLVTIALAATRGEYSHSINFISELGATGTPRASIMNYLGFVPAGLLIVVFGLALARLEPRAVLGLIGSALVIVFGLGVAVSGVISCDPGCPLSIGSAQNIAHNTIAPVAFICLIVGIAIHGYRFRRLPRFRFLSIYSLATSVVALVFFIGLVMSLDERTTTGLWQRLLLAALFLWCTVIGISTFRDSTNRTG